MIDDLVSRGALSLTECSLLEQNLDLYLRADNADLRLSQKAIELNLLRKKKKLFLDYKSSIEKCRNYLSKITLGPHEAENINLNLSKDGKKRSLYELIGYESLEY